jgi:hypothetical protein
VEIAHDDQDRREERPGEVGDHGREIVAAGSVSAWRAAWKSLKEPATGIMPDRL